jgi:CHAD domain-containing protein
MDPAVSLEIERKYDVADGAPVPLIAGTHPIVSQDAPEVVELSATYFDTARADLAAARITLRQRVGGHDEGWHVKLPASMGRTEMHWPLGDIGTEVPVSVSDAVRVHVRDRTLRPIARLETNRRTQTLRAADDVAVAEICDDRVSAESLHDGQRRQWREWEVELLPDAASSGLSPEGLLDSIEGALKLGGALPPRSVSKLSRAMGKDLPAADPVTGESAAHTTALTALQLILSGLVAALKIQDPRVRADEPDSVHAMRIVVRKLRSVLRTYRTVLDRTTVDTLRQRLRVFGAALGAARDSEVRRDRAIDHLESSTAVNRTGLKRVADRYAQAYAAAHERAAGLLDSEDYFRLLDDLDVLSRQPPAGRRATENAVEVLRRGIRTDLRRLKQLAAANEQPELRPDALLLLRHDVRKAARRLRYSAEAAREFAPSAFGAETLALAELGHTIQSELGEQRDSQLFAVLLRDEATDAYPAERKALKEARHQEKELAKRATARYRKTLRALSKAKPPAIKLTD